MKLNMSCPTTGMQKCVDIDDDKKLLPFFDKRMAQEVAGDALGDEFKGYRFRISGGNDKKGPAEIPGLTDSEKPLRLGPKRATKIRKLFDLTPEDDVRKFVVRRQVTTKGEKTYSKAPKIQRLVTSTQLQRKR